VCMAVVRDEWQWSHGVPAACLNWEYTWALFLTAASLADKGSVTVDSLVVCTCVCVCRGEGNTADHIRDTDVSACACIYN